MPIDVEKLIKIMRLTTSDKEGEVLAAINRANSMLKLAGVGWEEVLQPKHVQTIDIFGGARPGGKQQAAKNPFGAGFDFHAWTHHSNQEDIEKAARKMRENSRSSSKFGTQEFNQAATMFTNAGIVFSIDHDAMGKDLHTINVEVGEGTFIYFPNDCTLTLRRRKPLHHKAEFKTRFATVPQAITRIRRAMVSQSTEWSEW